MCCIICVVYHYQTHVPHLRHDASYETKWSLFIIFFISPVITNVCMSNYRIIRFRVVLMIRNVGWLDVNEVKMLNVTNTLC